MPDVSINDLPSASSMSDSGLLVVYQNSTTQSITGQKVKSYAETAATDIAEPVAAAAVADKFDDMSVTATTLTAGSQATATYDADTNTLALGIPKGADGTGAGDMTKAVYDPDGDVETAGGIPAFIGDKIDDPSTKSSGQVLTYNGSTWEAANPSGGAFIVNITSSGSTYTADKTFSEISAAYNSGSVIYAVNDGITYQLDYFSDNFKVVFVYSNGNVTSNGYEIRTDNSVTPFQRTILNRTTSLDVNDTNYATIMARGIYAGTADMTEGTSNLTSGVIYLQYE